MRECSKYVVSASAMSTRGCASRVLGRARNRWRQRKAVLGATFRRSAALWMLWPSRGMAACVNRLPLWRRRASAVQVRELNVLLQPQHSYRCGPSACPFLIMRSAPQCEQDGVMAIPPSITFVEPGRASSAASLTASVLRCPASSCPAPKLGASSLDFSCHPARCGSTCVPRHQSGPALGQQTSPSLNAAKRANKYAAELVKKMVQADFTGAKRDALVEKASRFLRPTITTSNPLVCE